MSRRRALIAAVVVAIVCAVIGVAGPPAIAVRDVTSRIFATPAGVPFQVELVVANTGRLPVFVGAGSVRFLDSDGDEWHAAGERAWLWPDTTREITIGGVLPPGRSLQRATVLVLGASPIVVDLPQEGAP